MDEQNIRKSVERNMTEIEMIPVNSNSGNLVSAGYDDLSQTLKVKFQSSEYTYADVPSSLWRDFNSTFGKKENSTGAFFAKNIRNKFTSKKVEGKK